MAVDKLVDSTQLNSDLTSIANAIRTKGGTSAQLAFPSGFVSAVQGIGNTYTAGDEGKVVSSGALVAQTSQSITENGTYDTTLKNEVVVDVSGEQYGNGAGLITSAKLNTSIPDELYLYLPKLVDASQMFFNVSSNTVTSIYIKTDAKPTSIANMFNTRSINPACVITLDMDLSQCSNYGGTFGPRLNGDRFAKKIVANLDFTSVTASTNLAMFGNNTDIEELTFVANTLQSNFSIPVAPNLTNATLVSLANCLKAVSDKSITLHATPKANLSTIMGTVSNNGTYDIFTEDAGGSTSLMSFITTTKGWTVA